MTAQIPHYRAGPTLSIQSNGPEIAQQIPQYFHFIAPEGPAQASVAERTEASPERRRPNNNVTILKFRIIPTTYFFLIIIDTVNST